jgi:glycine cleavage system H protein
MNTPRPDLEAPGGIRVPTDRLYTRTHLWLLPLPDRPRGYRLGVSAYACRWGIEVYFLENVPPPGTAVEPGSPLGDIETEKAAAQLPSPLAGRIAGVNEAVLADPSIITFDGYGAGWILELEGEPVDLLTAAEYVAYLATLPPPQCFVKRADELSP